MLFNKTEIEEVKNLFLQIWKIDNPSWDEWKVAKFIEKYFSAIDQKVVIDKTNNILVKLKWEWESVLINAHIDSVNPATDKCPQFNWKLFHSNWKTVLWADDLAWVAVMLFAVKYLKKNKIKIKNAELLFTSMEEIWWKWIKQFKFSSLKSKQWLIIDSIDTLWAIVTEAPSKYNFCITATWIWVHGKNIAKWVSAIKMMWDLISKLKLWIIKKWLFLNIWKIYWWTAVNSVPDKAFLQWYVKTTCEWEIRWQIVESQKVIDYLHEKIALINKKYPKWKLELNCELVRNWYSINKSEPFLVNIKKAIKDSWLKPKLVKTFWTSDANTINAMWIKISMIWMWIKWAHTVNETISLHNIVKLSEIVVNYLRA